MPQRIRMPDRDNSSASGRFVWALLPFFFIVMVMNFIDRTNVGFAALRMNTDLALSAEAFGFGAGLLSAGEALFAVPSGLAAQRFGLDRWIALLLIVWGSLAGAMALIGAPLQFFVLRFLLGAAEGGVLPCITAYLSRRIAPDRLGRALAVVSAGSATAAVVNGPLGALLFRLDGVAGIEGWRWLFFWEGVPAIGLGLLALWFLPRVPPIVVPDKAIASKVSLLVVLRERPVIALLALLNFCIATTVLASLLWAPLVASEVPGFGVTAVGWAISAIFLLSALGMLVVGWLSDRRRRRFRYLTVCLVLAAFGFLAAGLSPSPILTLVALGFGVTFLRSSAGDFFVGASELLPRETVSAGLALIGAFAAIGGFLGPTLVGWVKTHTGSYSGAFLGLSALLLIAAVLGSVATRVFARFSTGLKSSPAVVVETATAQSPA
jgi:MFS transporter, ACS family, tartrate transporter